VASEDSSTGLRVIDTAGNASRIGPSGVSGTLWQFDGQRLAYTTSNLASDHVFIADTPTDGGSSDRSGRELDLIGLPPASAVQPVLWTRAAGIIAWLRPQHSVPLGADGAALVAIDPDTGTMRMIATTLTYPDWLAYQPAVSSSTAAVVVVSGGNRDAFTDKQTLVCDNAFVECQIFPVDSGLAVVDPAWSPDGQHLAMVIADTSSRTESDLLSASTSLTLASTRDQHIGPLLANTSATAHPMWLPDSRHVLAVQGNRLVAFDTSGMDPPTTVVAPLTGPDSDALGRSYYGHTDWTALVAVS
jgi:Tol biopolymer transport system component